MRRLRLSFVVLLLVALVAPMAVAEPDSSRLRQLEAELEELRADARAQERDLERVDDRARELAAERSAAEAELEAIGVMLSEVVEQYNEAQVELETIQSEQAETAEELDVVQADAAERADAVAGHARRLYRLGRSLEFATVLSGDVNDAGFRSTTLRFVLDNERANLEELTASRDRIEGLQERLAVQEQAADAAALRVEAEVREVEAAYDAYDAVVEQLQATIDRVEAEQAEGRADLADQRATIRTLEGQVTEERARIEAAAREAERRRQEEAQRAREAAASQRSTTATSSEGARGGASGSATGGSATSSPAPAPAPAAPAARQSASVAVQTALAQVGKPYVWGGNGPNGFDCSGLTSFAWRAAGVSIPRTSRAQYSGLRNVSRAQLQPGDLVFYNSPISHVAMYVGNDTIVEASRRGVPVRTARLSARNPVGYARP